VQQNKENACAVGLECLSSQLNPDDARQEHKTEVEEEFRKMPEESRKRNKRKADAEEDFDAMPEELKKQIATKWSNFVQDGATGEIAKLQLLAAAILHAKANEISVRNGIHNLCVWAKSVEDGDQYSRGLLTAEMLAQATAAELESQLEGIHWHKTKASRLIAASKELLRLYGGNVPTDKASLLRLPGIGTKLSNVLSFVLGALDLRKGGETERDKTEHAS
jgi:endonuclease III